MIASANAPTKTVLIAQPSDFQAQTWKVALNSQRIVTTLENGDPSATLAKMKSSGIPLPTLLLVDMGLLNKKHYDFSRWCRDQCPDMGLVFTDGTRDKISDTEQRWSNSQGVQDLLPGFQEKSFLEDVIVKVSRVLELLAWWPLQREALVEALKANPSLQKLLQQPVEAPTQSSDFFSGAFSLPLGQPVSSENPLAVPQSYEGLTPQPISGFVTPQTQQATPQAQKKVAKKPPEDPPASGRSYRGAIR